MIARIKKRLYLSVAWYFKFWANLSFRRWNPRVIAITGSVGKTTMLRLVELQMKNSAHYSHNANGAFGIAFDIVGLAGVTDSKWRWLYLFMAVPFRSLWFKHQEEFYVVEIDGERPKETEFLARWLRPEVTLWVSLGRSHAMYYDEQVRRGQFQNVDDAIAHEFGWLPRLTQKLVIADGDNKLIKTQLKDIQANVELISQQNLQKYQVFADHAEFEIGKNKVTFPCPMPREVSVQLLLLQQLANYLDLPLITDLADYVPPAGRNSFLQGKNGLKLIDSSYNAHLISMRSILEMMQEMQVSNKWLVIGDMTEQGEGEADQHQKLGQILAKIDAQKYILVGRRTAKYTAPILEQAGLADKTLVFQKAPAALEYIESNTSGNETILFKGSQYLEWIVEKLLQDPTDVKLLPRQEPSSIRRRAEWGLK